MENMKYEICYGRSIYKRICDKEVILKLLPSIKKDDSSKFVIFLTLDNHIPVHDTIYNEDCDQYPMKLNPQFCTLYLKQMQFNNLVNNFAKNLNNNDLLIFFSDTPPIFSKRDQIHFNNFIDVYFIKKSEKK